MRLFSRDPFDLAPRAGRHPPAAWLALAAGLAFAAICAVPLATALDARTRAEREGIDRALASRRRNDAEAAARLAQTDPVALERVKAQRVLQNQLRLSWTGLFDALEAASGAANGGATVLSLAPAASRDDAAEIAITAMATSVPVMLTYVRALQAGEQIREVRLSAQQPASSAGAATVRFQLSLLWVPVDRPADAANAAAASAPVRAGRSN